jgi:hypothetical protein
VRALGAFGVLYYSLLLSLLLMDIRSIMIVIINVGFMLNFIAHNLPMAATQ